MKKLMIALLALGAFGTLVFAGEMKKDGSVLLGYGMPGGDVGSDADAGLAFGLGYEGYKINDTFSIGGEFLYASGSGDFSAGSVTADYNLSTFGLVPYVKASKEIEFGGKKADLYGLAGLGYYSIKQELSGFTGIYSVLNTSVTDSKFGFSLGGGIAFPIGDKMKLGADLRYHIPASNLSYFIPSAKLTYSF